MTETTLHLLISKIIEQWIVIALFIACFINYPKKSLRVLTFIVFAFFLINSLLYDIIFSLGRPKITWNFSWILMDCCMYMIIHIKMKHLPCKRDMQILGLTVFFIVTHFIQMLDWNFNGHTFMRGVMQITTPTINILIVSRLYQDILLEFMDKMTHVFDEYSMKKQGKLL